MNLPSAHSYVAIIKNTALYVNMGIMLDLDRYINITKCGSLVVKSMIFIIA